MPPKKNNYYRRRRPSKKYNAGAVALRKVNMLMKEVEDKYDDLSIAGQSIATNGITNHLTSIAEGMTSLTRTGLKITPVSVYARLHFLANQNVSASDVQYIRLLFVRDRQQEADTPPAASDILNSPTITSPLNRLRMSRFQVLYDRVFKVSKTTDGSSSPEHFVKVWLGPKRLSKHPVRYNGAATTDIQKNGLYMIYLSDTVAPYEPTVNADVRFRFSDL